MIQRLMSLVKFCRLEGFWIFCKSFIQINLQLVETVNHNSYSFVITQL